MNGCPTTRARLTTAHSVYTQHKSIFKSRNYEKEAYAWKSAHE